jgi:acyl-coenzyme A thioesterase PaaI-like protein
MVCDATVHAVRGDGEKLVATMTGTMMVVKGRGISD